MDDFTITDEDLEQAWVVHVGGELDAFTAPRLRDHITTELAGRTSAVFVLDLTQVSFMDSAGLGLCVAALRRARAAGLQEAVVAASRAVLHLFELTGFSEAYRVHPSVRQALTSTDV